MIPFFYLSHAEGDDVVAACLRLSWTAFSPPIAICSPPNYYDCIYGVPDGMNMDRGGFGHSR